MTSSSFRLSRALDESGKYVFVVVPAGQNAPTINDVLRLRGGGDASPLACGVVQVSAGYVEANRTIFGRPLLRVNKSKTDASVNDFFYGMDVESGETRASSQTLSRQCFERKVPIIAATTSVDRIDRSFYGLGSFTADTDSLLEAEPAFLYADGSSPPFSLTELDAQAELILDHLRLHSHLLA